MSDYISREQAIEEINKYRMTSGVSNQGTWNECVDVIAHTVSELPSADFRENKGDLISRQAVLDGIAEWIADGYADSVADCSHISSLVSHLPSVENKGEWIPVSERLPVLRGTYKISDDVLITNGYEIDMGYLVERTGKIFWHYYGSEYEVGIKDEDNDATAWMPLPKPYKAKKGGEE